MSYIGNLENTEELVADWGIDLIERVVGVLLGDAAPYNSVKQTDEERLQEYVEAGPDRRQFFTGLIKQNAMGVIDKLQAAGLGADKIAGVHPYNIGVLLTIAYQQEMEELLNATTE